MSLMKDCVCGLGRANRQEIRKKGERAERLRQDLRYVAAELIEHEGTFSECAGNNKHETISQQKRSNR
jgi:hypothetical protein